MRQFCCETLAVGIIAEGTFTDPENSRRIMIAVVGLLVVAAVVLVGTVVWWRRARVEHPALAPLETMASRRYASADADGRSEMLDEVRPTDDDLARLRGVRLGPDGEVDPSSLPLWKQPVADEPVAAPDDPLLR
ncbi:MAG: hypothetical protein RLZ04_735 [Actinomycetota bacterium]|jgi:hypothetical protein